jgi:hypothetical protein
MRPPLNSRKNNRPEWVASAETGVPLIWGRVIVHPFVSLPLEERLNVGRDCGPPGSDLVDHREGIGKPAGGAKELPAIPKPRERLMIVGAAKEGYYMNL